MSCLWWIVLFAAFVYSEASSLSMFRGNRGQSNQGFLDSKSSASKTPLFSSSSSSSDQDPSEEEGDAYCSRDSSIIARANCVVDSARNLGVKVSLLRAVLCTKHRHCDGPLLRLVDVCVESQCESSCRLSSDVDACLDLCTETSIPEQSQAEDDEARDDGVTRSKRYRLGLYDCISSYCSSLHGDDRKSCIVYYCHRSATAQ